MYICVCISCIVSMYSYFVMVRVVVAPRFFVCSLCNSSRSSSSGISSSSNGGYGDDDRGDLQKGPWHF